MTEATRPDPHDLPEAHAPRRDWLGVLSRAQPAALAQAADALLGEHRFEVLRAPEVVLVMVRARIGNSGDRFNLGEATLTRCALRHAAADGSVVAGVGHVLGRDGGRAERIAKLDALLQRPDLQPRLMREVVEPLRSARAQHDQREHACTQASRVRFFTLQPEAA
jgi:alpha-D-ribose 1-methylphosphonate 5-triphosphate synthase subunit PhnG